MPFPQSFLVPALCALSLQAWSAEIERIWLSHARESPSAITINWETEEPAESVVEFGSTPSLGEKRRSPERVRLHHVEVPFADAGLHYRVRSGHAASEIHYTPGYAGDELRVAIIGDIGYAKDEWAPAIAREKPHLLLTAGDNVAALHNGTAVDPETTAAFSKLIDRAPALFQTTRFMPVLGNHDREIRPRGPKPPPEAVYDVTAQAYRSFFALPGEEWRWTFDLPDFGVRFVALDLNHVQDIGTTWQTCHPYAKDGPQFGWYRDVMSRSDQPFVITVFNEKSSVTRGLEKGEWGKLIARGSMAVTGFGYFAERAEVDGFPYLNTAVKGTGDKYPDPKSTFFASENNFVLLRFPRDRTKLIAEIRNLHGAILDTRVMEPRKR